MLFQQRYSIIFQWPISYVSHVISPSQIGPLTSNDLHPKIWRQSFIALVAEWSWDVSMEFLGSQSWMKWSLQDPPKTSQNDITSPNLLSFRIYRVKSGQFGEAPNGLDDMTVGTSMEFQCCKFWALLETPFSSSTYLANEGELWGPPKIRNRNRSWSCYIITLRETNINNLIF